MKISSKKAPRTPDSPDPASVVPSETSDSPKREVVTDDPIERPVSIIVPTAVPNTTSDGSEPDDEHRVSPGVRAQEKMLLGDLA